MVAHRRNLIVLLSGVWEDRYRNEIATQAGLKCKNDVKSSVFKDVTAYRNAIVHANGMLNKKTEVFDFFRRGEEVNLTGNHIDTIFRAVVEELNRLGREYFDSETSFSFEEPLNA